MEKKKPGNKGNHTKTNTSDLNKKKASEKPFERNSAKIGPATVDHKHNCAQN